MTSAEAARLLDQGDAFEAAAQQFAGCHQACDTCADDADAVLCVTAASSAARLLKQAAIVETQIRRVGKAGGPRQAGGGLQGGREVGGMVVGGANGHNDSPCRSD